MPVGAAVFGVRFRLCLAGAALGLPAGEFLDGNAPVAELWGPAYDERVAAGGVAELVQIVRERLAGVPVDDVARAAALVMARPGARVDTLAFGLSERQLRRRFVDAVGYGPRRSRGFGASSASWGLGAQRAGDLARLAFSAGYADQAHLTRETRRLAGRTPARARHLAGGRGRRATRRSARASTRTTPGCETRRSRA